jgi:vacuolar-type H+-ATPase catalytic subunit A/Vma1
MGIDIDKVARDHYFKQADMVRYLLAENLALKMFLYEKGILTPEEFKKYQTMAEDTLRIKVERHVEEWKKANHEMIRLMNEAADAASQKEAPAAS